MIWYTSLMRRLRFSIENLNNLEKKNKNRERSHHRSERKTTLDGSN